MSLLSRLRAERALSPVVDQAGGRFRESDLRSATGTNSPGRLLAWPAAALRSALYTLSRPAVMLLVLALAALILRLAQVGDRGLWADEIFTALFSSPNNDLSTVVAQSLATPLPTPPLWFLLTHAFVKLFGSTEFAIRLPSVIAGVLSVIMIHKVGQLFFNRRVGLIAAALLAIAPYHILVAREGRFYAAMVFLALLSLYCLQKGMDTGKARWWIGFTGAALAGIYIHLTAFLFLAVLLFYAGAVLLWRRWSARRDGRPFAWRRSYGPMFLISLGLIAVAYLPMTPHLIAGMLHDSRGLGGSSPEAVLPVTTGEFQLLLVNFSAGAGLNLILYLGAALLGLIEAIRHRRQTVFLMVLWFLVPFVAIFLMRPKHWFNTKYVVAMLPIYLILAAAGISRGVQLAAAGWHAIWRGRTGRWPLRISLTTLLLAAALLFYGALNAASPRMTGVYRQNPGGWRELGQVINDNVGSDDVVASPPLVLLTMPATELMSYYGPSSAVELNSLGQLEELLAAHRRVWIVRRPSDIERPGLERRLPELQEIWDNLPPHVELSVGSGVRILYMGQNKTRLTLLNEVQRFEGLPPAALASIARTYRNLGLPDEALRAIQRATAVEPEAAGWQFLEGTIYESQGDLDEALTIYENVSGRALRNPSFLFTLGLAFERLGEQSQAIEQYERALSHRQPIPLEEENQELYYAINQKLTSLKAEPE